MSQPGRRDLPTGAVPDYRTFVRHLWSYRDPEGTPITPPPFMYRVIFDGGACSDWVEVRSVVEFLVDGMNFGEEIEWSRMPLPASTAWEVRFRTMGAIHAFCTVLGERAKLEADGPATRVGEFVMWTLGFRWV